MQGIGGGGRVGGIINTMYWERGILITIWLTKHLLNYSYVYLFHVDDIHIAFSICRFIQRTRGKDNEWSLAFSALVQKLIGEKKTKRTIRMGQTFFSGLNVQNIKIIQNHKSSHSKHEIGRVKQ